jgi:hypothetical protein
MDKRICSQFLSCAVMTKIFWFIATTASYQATEYEWQYEAHKRLPSRQTGMSKNSKF